MHILLIGLMMADNPLGLSVDNASMLSDRQSGSRTSSRQPSTSALDRRVSFDPRRDSEYDRIRYVEYDDDVDEHGTTLDERIARDRIMHLHDVFVSSQGREGLNMQDFRAVMRKVQLKDSGREMEDNELDKVRYIIIKFC